MKTGQTVLVLNEGTELVVDGSPTYVGFRVRLTEVEGLTNWTIFRDQKGRSVHVNIKRILFFYQKTQCQNKQSR